MRTRHHDEGARQPLLVLRPQRDGKVAVTVNGHQAAKLVRTAELGQVLARVAEHAGQPVRVEIHQPDGTVHSDTIIPPVKDRQAPPVLEADALSLGGFLPGEPVHLALVLTTVVADQHGRATARLPRRLRRRSGPLLTFGVRSGTTTLHDRTA